MVDKVVESGRGEFLRKLAKVKSIAPHGSKEARIDHIYRVAAGIMCEKGYDATSMNDIADAVGLTKAGLYHYLRGKEDLLFQIMTFGMDKVDEDVIFPARSVEDPEERLHTIVERHSKRILEVGGAVTLVLEETYALTPAHRRIIQARKRDYFELIRRTLDDLAVEGKLRRVNTTVATFALLGMVLWISRWHKRDGKLRTEDALPSLVEIAMNSVMSRRGQPEEHSRSATR